MSNSDWFTEQEINPVKPFLTEEERKEKNRLKARKYREENPAYREGDRQRTRRYRENNRDSVKESARKSAEKRNQDPNRRAEYLKYKRSHNHFKNYGITLEERNQMYIQQNGLCANLKCQKPITLYMDKNQSRSLIAQLDHNRATNKVRELLCFGCNLSIGHLGDSSETAQGLVDYLKKHGN